MRDYLAWHRNYDDPDSSLSWRLANVRDLLRTAFDAHAGPVSVLSLCAGDGRDVLGVLTHRPDRDRFGVTLVEIEPELVDRARAAAVAIGVEADVRQLDAARPDGYADAVPADVVLLVGIFGNISDEDTATTIAAAPQLCRPGATLLWSRGRHRDDRNDAVRARFTAAGFTELDYRALDTGSRPAIGAVRYGGPAAALAEGQRLFTFLR